MEDISLDPAQFAEHRLSDDEWAQFDRDGYFIIENAITEAEGLHLRTLLHNMHRELEARGSYSPDHDIREGVFSRNNNMQEDDTVMSLLTQPKVFPKIVDIMGANIYNWHNFTPCTRRAPAGTRMPTLEELQHTEKRFNWHRDGGFERYFTERPTPRMTVKAVYYLSDVSEPGRGNTWIVPGSHKRGAVTVDVPEVEGLGGVYGQPEGAIPVCCPPNSALIFDRRLLHTGTPNYSTQHERLLFIIGYGYRWLRARDGLYVEPAMNRAKCPVVRQLLGATSSSVGLFQPAGVDTPLALWLHQHRLGYAGGLGRDHQHHSRWSLDGVGPQTDPAARKRIMDGDVGGHGTFPRHPWRAEVWNDAEPPTSPLVAGAGTNRNFRTNLSNENPHVAAAPTEQEILGAVKLAPADWLSNGLTDHEVERFKRDGYLVLSAPGLATVMSDADVTALQGLEQEHERRTRFMFSSSDPQLSKVVARMDLLSNPVVLPRVVQLLASTNICCHHARVIAAGSGDEASNSSGSSPGLSQDVCGWLDRDLEIRPSPLISVTALYAVGELADEPDIATIRVLPGSHMNQLNCDNMLDTPPSSSYEIRDDLTIGVRVPHGGCVLLDRRLWRTHPADVQCSQTVVEVGYGPRWLRPADPMYVEDALEIATCPIQRQMLNWHSSCAGYWSPNVDDVPLLAWLNHHDLPPGQKGATLPPAWAYGDGTKADDGHSSRPRAKAMQPQVLLGLDATLSHQAPTSVAAASSSAKM